MAVFIFTALNGTCKSSHFACVDNKKCILDAYECDGERDCDDGSDEAKCKSKCIFYFLSDAKFIA